MYLVLPCFIFAAGSLPEQNLLGEETGRGSKEPHPFSPCPCVFSWTSACSQPACGESCPCSACQHRRGALKLLKRRFPSLVVMGLSFALLQLVLQQPYQNGESEENHEQFLKDLQYAVTTFLNRMKSNHMRGRSITNDSAVLSLFQSINNMHPQLLDILNQLDEKRREWELCIWVYLHLYRSAYKPHWGLSLVSVLWGTAGQAGPGAWRSSRPERASRRTQREAEEGCRGCGETAADPAGTEAGDHEAEEAGDEIWLFSIIWDFLTLFLTHKSMLLAFFRSIWRCKDSWPFSASRSRRRRGRCVWSSKSTQSRWEPRCRLSLCLTLK